MITPLNISIDGYMFFVDMKKEHEHYKGRIYAMEQTDAGYMLISGTVANTHYQTVNDDCAFLGDAYIYPQLEYEVLIQPDNDKYTIEQIGMLNELHKTLQYSITAQVAKLN